MQTVKSKALTINRFYPTTKARKSPASNRDRCNYLFYIRITFCIMWCTYMRNSSFKKIVKNPLFKDGIFFLFHHLGTKRSKPSARIDQAEGCVLWIMLKCIFSEPIVTFIVDRCDDLKNMISHFTRIVRTA